MDNSQSTQPIVTSSTHPLYQVTVVSKYLALALFISLPFLGGYVGYSYAPEKIVEVERLVETQKVQAPTLSEEFDDLYTYELPAGWSKTVKEFRGGVESIVAPTPLEIEENYTDELGYYHETDLDVSIQHFPADHIFDENKTFMRRVWPGEYGTLLSAIYRSDDEFGKAALSSLGFGIFPATLFETKNKRFKGVSVVDTYAQDYSFNPRYKLSLVDNLYGDIIVVSITLEGEEINDIRSLLATPETDRGELQLAKQTFLDLLNSKSRDELSFGYLMKNLEDFANSFEGGIGRESASRIYIEESSN